MSTAGLRERKKLQTRLDIVRGLLDLLAQKPYDEITVDDIVDRANCSRSTFFRYFNGKEDVLFSDATERLATLLNSLDGIDGRSDPLAAVRDRITETVLDFVSVAPDLEAACVSYWFTEPSLHRRFLELVLEAEQRVAEFFAASWRVPPGERDQCGVLAAGVLGIARVAIRSQLWDEAALRRTLSRGFDLLEQGSAQTFTGRSRR